MSLIIELPADIETMLRGSQGNLAQSAREAMLVEMYRQRQVNHSQLARGLGISRDEANGILKRHQVEEDLLTVADFQEQLGAIGLGHLTQ